MSKIMQGKPLLLVLGLKPGCFNWGLKVVALSKEVSVVPGSSKENKSEHFFKRRKKEGRVAESREPLRDPKENVNEMEG